MLKVILLAILLCAALGLAQHEHHHGDHIMNYDSLPETVKTILEKNNKKDVRQMGPAPGKPTGPSCGTTSPTNSVRVTTTTSTLGTFWSVDTNNCPNYDWSSQKTPNSATVMTTAMVYPRNPILSKNKIYVGILGANNTANPKFIGGAIGVSRNGIYIYSNSDADSRDAYIYESKTFDQCYGHPDASGSYHYHMEPNPTCGVLNTAVTTAHSPIFGVMADGIPIYGQRGDNGTYPTDLDECGGHVDKTYPFYHYHLPKNMVFPYTVSCLRGCVYSNNPNKLLANLASQCVRDDVQYDYSSLSIADWTRSSGNKNLSPQLGMLTMLGSVLLLLIFV